MKTWRKTGVRYACLLISVPLLAFLFSRAPGPGGSVALRDVVSCCVGRAESGGAPELLVIAGEGETGAGERYGGYLLVCDASAGADLIEIGYIPPGKIRRRIDLTGIRPMKVQLGDVNGDGVNEVAVCAYKTAKFHPVMAKRPFFFDLTGGNLVPVWLGSRLSRPFDDYILRDMNSDGADEIVSVERLENGKRVIAVYGWKGFGFEMLAQSEEFGGELRFEPDPAGRTVGEISAGFSSFREHAGLQFRFSNGRLICSSIKNESEG